MNYIDAIKYLKENDIKKEDGTYYEFGDVRGSSSGDRLLLLTCLLQLFHSQDIPEAPERQMTDKINKVYI